MSELKRPAYYHIPEIVANEVSPHESFVFSVVYWFEKMRDGKCFASNQAIMEALPYQSSAQSVNNALKTLEEKGFIIRFFKDKNKRVRDKIECLVDFKVQPTGVSRSTHRFNEVKPTGLQNSNNIIIKKNSSNKSKSDDLPEIPILIKEFEKIDLKNKNYYGNKTQRKACKFLIENYSFVNVVNVVNFYLYAKKQQNQASFEIRKVYRYLPEITSPYEMQEKWSKLGTFIGRLKDRQDEAVSNLVI